MRQLHIHERGAHVVLYNATTRRLYDRYAEFNTIVGSSRRSAGRTCSGRASPPRTSGTGSNWTCATATSCVTQAVALDINRISGVGDVLHVIRTFGDVYGHRFGARRQSPEAGIRVADDSGGLLRRR